MWKLWDAPIDVGRYDGIVGVWCIDQLLVEGVGIGIAWQLLQ